MEYDVLWDNEVVADNDELIAKLEAEIAETKKLLHQLAESEDLY